MKPGFVVTKKRIYERVAGSVVGGVSRVGILLLVRNPAVFIGFLLLFIFLAFTFITYNYRIAVVFITPYVLILFQLIDPGNFDVVQERVMDTMIGGGIAFLASYLLWPIWEHQPIKTYLPEILDANREYFKQVASAYPEQPLSKKTYKPSPTTVHF